ncbi:glycerate kinase [Actinotalea sp. K2]|uniref:glycerate kinase n=1 Tax=Actinotalea sp. K2 TaxID=2939438 RepID=UPI0024B5E11E|nr:glycerate kinase [Actinotalea sp. K2]
MVKDAWAVGQRGGGPDGDPRRRSRRRRPGADRCGRWRRNSRCPARDSSRPSCAGSEGLGIVLRHALTSGVSRVLIGLGGTATTDGGTGLLAALGAELRDGADDPPPDDPGNLLLRVEAIAPGTFPELGEVELIALTDVDNPLLGDQGAAAVYGPQKGATPGQVTELDGRMAGWADILEATTGLALRDRAGAGAAGGLGAALLALGARVEPGAEVIAREVELSAAIQGADLVITGEGRVEHPLGATGYLFDAVMPIHPHPMSVADAMDAATTAAGLAATAGEVVRLVRAIATR